MKFCDFPIILRLRHGDFCDMCIVISLDLVHYTFVIEDFATEDVSQHSFTTDALKVLRRKVSLIMP